MSELKTYIAPTPDGTGLADYYLKSEVDKVISELKDKCQMHDFFWTGAWSDTILVDTRTGKHFFALEYLRSHSKQELFHELAYGNIVHDEKWDGKIKEAK